MRTNTLNEYEIAKTHIAKLEKKTQKICIYTRYKAKDVDER